ncbi:TniB family NTP-binding protein [Yoonia rosea]|nr:TniB family NTP-binding protein [Yoonia rosea]
MSTDADLKPSVAVLKTLKSRYYELPRLQKLDSAFDRVLDQFLSAYLAGQHIEGRGLLVTGGTRTGKSHDIKYLLRSFAASEELLAGNFQRKYLRVSLRTNTSWRGLGVAFLEAMEYPFSLDHRSTATIWSRAEAQLRRDKYLVLNIDEAQHLFMGKKDKEIEVILNGLKDLMKRPGWPVLPIYSGVPELMDHANANEQLTSLLEPVTYEDIAYDATSLTEVDAILVTFSEVVGLDPAEVRNSDVYNRLIHASNRRWGRLIELIVHALAEICVEHPDRNEVLITDFALIFQRWTGVSDAANVFLVENPYRISVGVLYKK